MAGHDIMVVGASAGGVESLSRLVSDLPEDLPAAVFIVLHVGPHWNTALPRILGRQARLPVDHARDGEPVRPGRLYVARPDHHLLVEPGAVRVTPGPKENGHRPSIDTLFRTAAAHYGPRVVGVVLSGTLDDGTAGLRAIHARGGLSVVQDPDDALFPGMPESALAGDHADFVVPLREIGSLLADLARKEPVPEGRSPTMPDELDAELRWANTDLGSPAVPDPPLGVPSGFTCPDCHGALWEIEDHDLPRYRCRVGHGFSAESLLVTQQVDVKAALWAAYRALEERAALFRRLAERALSRHAGMTGEHFRAEADEVSRQAQLLRGLLRTGTGGAAATQSGPIED